MKFKKGDKVRVKRDLKRGNRFGLYVNDYMERYAGKITTIKAIKDCGHYGLECDSDNYCWTDDMIEPVKNETIVIYRNCNKVIALDKSTGKKAEVVCSPEDEFDFEMGAILAFERLLTPELYNGKVVCIERNNDFLTQGKIYEFKNGKSINDNGRSFPYFGVIHSLDELNEIIWSKFIEVVE